MTEEAASWTLYWHKNTPQSCITSQQDSDAEAIDSIWQEFVMPLNDDAVILDLATGNGAVPAAMLRHQQGYRITGIDQADINPLKYLSEPGNLHRVQFLGGVDAAHLPIDDASSDAVSSQFGIEYGNLDSIAGEIARVLKQGGIYRFIMHHPDSAIVRPNVLLKMELERCLQSGGLIETLQAHLAGHATFTELEQSGELYLANNQRKTRQISGQVFEAIDVIARTAQQSIGQARQIADPMIERLTAEHIRLAQMQNASLSDSGMQSFKILLENHDLTVDESKPLSIGGAGNSTLIGWLVSGTKPERPHT